MRHLAALLVLVTLAGCSEDPTTTDDVGDAEACEAVETWKLEAADAEVALLDAVNEARRVGATCDGEVMPPVFALEIEPSLRCASRLHARDLSSTGALSHEGSDGSTTLERMSLAGYDGFPRHELLAADFVDGKDVVDAWLADPDHCRALLDADIEHAGPGAHENHKGDNIAWVLTTGEPRPE